MSDAVGRPVAIATPLTGQPWPAAGTSGFTIFGAPLHVVTQLPDPGKPTRWLLEGASLWFTIHTAPGIATYSVLQAE
jgi:hypothetical protein